jgi:hypothetical protein
MAKADEDAAVAKAERANDKARELKADVKRLEKLNNKYRRDYKKVQEEPNVVQLAVTGLAVAGGAGLGVMAHRELRKMTDTWRAPVDETDTAAKDAITAYKAGKATPEQIQIVHKSTTRTGLAVLVAEVLPITLGLATGGITAASDNGVVASAGGLGWGFTAGTLIDCFLPGPPPPPPKAPAP